jgi:hypothetical protein
VETVRAAPAVTAVTLLALGVVVGVGVGAVAVAASVPAAGADPMSDCTTTTGVVVVVDFTSFGGNVERGCAGAPSDGLTALEDAGFTPTPVSGEPGYFVCRIDGEPSPSEQACVSTPSATAYWSYWYADAGQSTWSQWQLGAASSDPQPGSVDAWSFGSGRPPSVPPSAVRATTPGPTPTGSSTTTAAPSGGGTTPPTSGTSGPSAPAGTATSHASGSVGSGSVGSGSAPSPATPGGLGTGAQSGSPSGASSGSGTATSGSSGRDGATGHGSGASRSAGGSSDAGRSTPGHSSARAVPRIVDVTPALARPSPSAGSPVATIVGGSVAVALAGAGGVTAWRRRVRTR